MRSKYCFFGPKTCLQPSFWFDSVYPRAITEHPEDLFTLYVMRARKRKRRTFGVFSSFLKKGFAILWTIFCLQKSPDFFCCRAFGLFLPSLFVKRNADLIPKRVRRYFQNSYSYPNAVRRSANTSSCSLII